MAFSRRRFLKAGGAVAAGMLAPWAAAQAKRPNLLFIMTDQHPFGAIGAYGTAGVKTPNIDRIAAEGVRFDRFYIAAFPCSPSRASFLTGRHAHNHGVVTNDVILSDAVPSLGAALKRAGYHTGYVGKWHLTGQMYRGRTGAPMNNEWYYERVPSADGFRFERKPGGTGEDVPQHGFDYWVGGWTHYHDYLRQAGLEKFAEQKIGNHSIAASGPEGTHIYSEVPEDHHMSAFLAGNAVKFLEEQHGQDAPFGLVLSFYGPHLPVAPPRPWDTLYGLAEASLPASYPDNTSPSAHEPPVLRATGMDRGPVSRLYPPVLGVQQLHLPSDWPGVGRAGRVGQGGRHDRGLHERSWRHDGVARFCV